MGKPALVPAPLSPRWLTCLPWRSRGWPVFRHGRFLFRRASKPKPTALAIYFAPLPKVSLSPVLKRMSFFLISGGGLVT